MAQPNIRSFRDIVVYLSVGDNARARLQAAIALAREHGARLTGVEVNHPSVYDTERAPEAASLEESFMEEMRIAGLEHAFHAARDVEKEGWRAMYAHYADLVISPSVSEADAKLVMPGIPEEVLINGGVPVLVIPDLWQRQPLGKRIVVSWNASREATHAVHDALPLLTRAESVTVFGFDSRQRVLRLEADLLVRHLAAHGIAAKPFTWPDTGEIDPVDALFSCLSEEGADMIVAGGYGHPRLMERLIGGVSRSLMRTLTIPVLMSH